MRERDALLHDERLSFRRRLENALPVFGVWAHLSGADNAEILGASGADVLVIDLQHGTSTTADLVPLVRSARMLGMPALVRVPSANGESIMRALDAGSSGVIVPMVNSVSEAEQCVQACLYPPDGIRSWAPMWRETREEAQRTPDESNASVICLVMVETMEAVRVLPEILAIPGLGGIFIGPNDLALSAGLGRSSYRDSAEVESLLQDILDACADADKPAGLYCSDPEMARHWSTRGATFTTIGRDSALYLQALQGGLAVARGERSTDTATPPLKMHR